MIFCYGQVRIVAFGQGIIINSDIRGNIELGMWRGNVHLGIWCVDSEVLSMAAVVDLCQWYSA